MRSEGAVRQKLKQVRYRHLKRRIEAELAQCPGNCVFNALVDVPETSDAASVSLRVCTHAEANGNNGHLNPCDERIDRGERAASCPFFALRKDKDRIKQEFKAELDAMSLPQVALHYPDMAPLMWVLDGEVAWEDGDDEDGPGDNPPQPPDVEAPKPPPPQDPPTPPAPPTTLSRIYEEEARPRSWWERFLDLFRRPYFTEARLVGR